MSKHLTVVNPKQPRLTGFLPISFLTLIGLIIWVGVICFGLAWLFRYGNEPGLAAPAAPQWPKDLKELPLDPKNATALVFIHPYCPCSRATLGNLARLAARAQNKAKIYALFLSPSTLPSDWHETDTWRMASNIPGVKILPDTNGQIAHRFNVTTSGQVLLYGPDGQQRFNGGLTASKGHEGDNPSQDTVEKLLNRLSAAHTRQQAPVFGCSFLVSPAPKT